LPNASLLSVILPNAILPSVVSADVVVPFKAELVFQMIFLARKKSEKMKRKN